MSVSITRGCGPPVGVRMGVGVETGPALVGVKLQAWSKRNMAVAAGRIAGSNRTTLQVGVPWRGVRPDDVGVPAGEFRRPTTDIRPHKVKNAIIRIGKSVFTKSCTATGMIGSPNIKTGTHKRSVTPVKARGKAIQEGKTPPTEAVKE